MTKTQAIEMNPAAYSVEARRCAAETLRGMARHLLAVARVQDNRSDFAKFSAAYKMEERAEKLEATL